MPDFPSLAWVADADAALAAATDLDVLLGDAAFAVGYAVEGDGPIDYHLAVADGTARLLPGLGDASVVLRADAATAIAVHSGTVSAQDAVINGDLRLDGNATALIANRACLDAVNRVLDAHRAKASTDA